MEDQVLDQAPVWDDVKTFDGRPWRGRVDIVSAGYPCQPFSSAGHKKGTADPRHLWPDIARIVRESDPEWVFLENVPHHLRLGFPVVADDLRQMGFRFVVGLFSAREVGATHFRRRLFVLAHADSDESGELAGDTDIGEGIPIHGAPEQHPVRARTSGQGLECVLGSGVGDSGERSSDEDGGLPLFAPGPGALAAWNDILGRDALLKPALRRDADGMAGRLDRLHLAGNGVFPMVAAVAFLRLRAAFNDHLKGGGD